MAEQPQQPSPVLQAWHKQQLTLGFSGGGFLLPYHLGVFRSLAAMGIVSCATPMAGASAGSLVVSGIKAGLSLQQQMDSFLEAAHACRQDGVSGRLRKVLKAQLHKTMPPDAAERCSDGSCWISVTQVFPRPANKLYGGFSSREQLIKALLASCHLPRVSDGGLFTSYESLHKRVFDGGFSNLCPVPPIVPAGSSALLSTPAPDATLPPTATAAATAATAPTATATGATTEAATASSTAAAAHGAEEEEDRDEQPPTAPAAALLQRPDSTKGITTRLLPSKSTAKQAHGTSAGLGSFTRSLSAPEGRSHSHVHSSSSHSNSLMNCSSSSSAASHGLQQTRVSSSSFSHSSNSRLGLHRGFRLQQPGLWASRRHQQQQQQQAERLLAASCEVQGQGQYVVAEGWCAVRVCVLPARHMHEFPAMFRAPAADEVSIALDMFQDWPHDLNTTTNLALFPQDDDFLWDLFKRGEQDAASWAQQQGFPPEVLQRLEQGAADAPELKVVRRDRDSQQQQQGGGGEGHTQQPPQQQQQQKEAETVQAATQGMQQVQQELQQQVQS